MGVHGPLKVKCEVLIERKSRGKRLELESDSRDRAGVIE